MHAIAPLLELIEVGTWQSDLFRLASLTSVPVSADYGRRMRFQHFQEQLKRDDKRMVRHERVPTLVESRGPRPLCSRKSVRLFHRLRLPLPGSMATRIRWLGRLWFPPNALNVAIRPSSLKLSGEP